MGGGGGFYNAGTAELTNVTDRRNDATVRAGGIAGAPVTLHNTLIAHNTGANGNCHGAQTNGGGNLEFPGATCGVPVAARAPIGPLPFSGVFELLPGSEAIDTGTGTAPPDCPVRGTRSAAPARSTATATAPLAATLARSSSTPRASASSTSRSTAPGSPAR